MSKPLVVNGYTISSVTIAGELWWQAIRNGERRYKHKVKEYVISYAKTNKKD